MTQDLPDDVVESINDGNLIEAIQRLRDASGKLVQERFDPSKPRHVEIMATFAESCPDCREFLRTVGIPPRKRRGGST